MTTIQITTKSPPHYYGDTVRIIFILSALTMLFGLPAISGYLNIPTWFSVTGILVLAIAAGLTNPSYLWSAVLNSLVSALGFVIFEFAALQSFATRQTRGELFMANMLLGGLFLFGTYYSVRTLRGFFLRQKNEQS